MNKWKINQYACVRGARVVSYYRAIRLFLYFSASIPFHLCIFCFLCFSPCACLCVRVCVCVCARVHACSGSWTLWTVIQIGELFGIYAVFPIISTCNIDRPIAPDFPLCIILFISIEKALERIIQQFMLLLV